MRAYLECGLKFSTLTTTTFKKKNIFILVPNIHWKALEKDCDRKPPLSVIQIIQRPPACSSRTSHLQPLQSTLPKSWHILSQTAGLPRDGTCLHVSVHLADYF